MSLHDSRVSMRQMRDYAAEATLLASKHAQADLATDRLLLFGLTHIVEIIGEAARRVPNEIQSRHPEIRWRGIIGMRNRLKHGYDQVNPALLWTVLTTELPPLVRALDAILAKK